MKITVLSNGSVLTTSVNDRGSLDATHYMAHRGRVWIVSERGALVPAFDGLRLLPKEPLELAVRRGQAGARGTPPRMANVTTILALTVGALYAAAWLLTN